MKKLENIQLIKLARTILVCFILILYYAVSTNFKFTLNLKTDAPGIYNDLAKGFSKGQLNLDTVAHPKLKELKNPYDPEKNYKYRYFDASYYKGKYYSYFGAVPSILIHLPYYKVFNKGIPNSLSLFILTSLSFIVSILLLLHFKRQYFEKSSELITLISIVALGFANFSGLLLRRPKVYEIAIASEVLFLLLSILFFIKSYNNKSINFIYVALGSLSFGLAFGSKPTIAFTSIACLLLLKKYFFFSLNKLEKSKLYFSLFAPALLCLSIISIYNYARFENPFEFGGRFQTGNINYNKERLFSKSNIPLNLYYYLIEPPTLDKEAPFIHLTEKHIPPFIDSPQINHCAFNVGIFIASPILLILLFFPFFKKKSYSRFPTCDFAIIFLSGAIPLITLLPFVGNAMRYRAEFIPFLLICSLICWHYLDINLKGKQNLISKYTFVFLCMVCILCGSAFSYENEDLIYKKRVLIRYINH